MVEKKHYGRTASLLEMAGMSSGIMAPMLGGALLGFMGIGTVLSVTLCGNILAIFSLSLIDLGRSSQPAHLNQKPLLEDIKDGFACLLERRSLIALQSIYMVCNFLYIMSFGLLGPFILAKTGNNSMVFASVETAGGVGGLVGYALIALTGGPRNKVLGALGGWAGLGLLGICVVGLGRSMHIWMLGAFMCSILGSLDYSSNQALWQAKIPPHLQGRVFALRKTIALIINPLACMATGPLVDKFLEPAMSQGGSMAPIFGHIFGVGNGAGMAILFTVCGAVIAMVAMAAWAVPLIRYADSLIPDHVESPRSAIKESGEVEEALA